MGFFSAAPYAGRPFCVRGLRALSAAEIDRVHGHRRGRPRIGNTSQVLACLRRQGPQGIEVRPVVAMGKRFGWAVDLRPFELRMLGDVFTRQGPFFR